VRVDQETAALVALALEAWHATGGRFDATVLDAVVAAGYGVSFEAIVPGAVLGEAVPAPGMGAVVVDRHDGTVTLPPGVQLDLGGIGKGRAADRVLERLRGLGASGACVDLGGDVRVGGAARRGPGGWVVAVDDPTHPGRDLRLVHLADGAVTTSSLVRRRWTTAVGDAHHVIDPSTGVPVHTDLLAVTVVSASAAWGEVHAKAALVAGLADGAHLLERAGLAGLLVSTAGEVRTAGGVEALLLDRDGGLVGPGLVGGAG
jgi:thiamine biosynthesis lipoprotein